jgi:hypothetical protein
MSILPTTIVTCLFTLLVRFAPEKDPNNDDLHHGILDLGNNPIISDPVTPILSELGTVQTLTQRTGIFTKCNAIIQEAQNVRRNSGFEWCCKEKEWKGF